MSAGRLIVALDGRYKYRIYWAFEGDIGGHLCQEKKDGTGDPPADRDDWKHWAASRAVRSAIGVEFDTVGAYWELERAAKAALRLANEALKQERPLPAWAKTALENGWKPPKGWKA